MNEIKKSNDLFKSGELFTTSDVAVEVESTTLFSTDANGNPVKASQDVVFMKVTDLDSNEEIRFTLSKNQAVSLISALASAANVLRDKID